MPRPWYWSNQHQEHAKLTALQQHHNSPACVRAILEGLVQPVPIPTGRAATVDWGFSVGLLESSAGLPPVQE